METRTGRGFRYVLWVVLRNVWRGLRWIGIRVPVQMLVFHPQDRRTASQISEGTGGKRLLVFCDFNVFPLSFDIVFMLMNAEMARRERGCDKIDVAFIGHKSSPLFTDDDDPAREISAENYRMYVHNLGLEVTQLIASINDVFFFTNRALFLEFWGNAKGQYEFLPKEYSPYRPDYTVKNGIAPYYGMIHLFNDPSVPIGERFCLTPPDQKIEMAKNCLARIAPGKKIITITLRDTKVQTRRNSHVNEWQKFVDYIADTDSNIVFIILPDFHTLYAPPRITGSSVLELPEAVHSISFRAAVYQIAHLNLFTNTGPASLCYFNSKARYISFGFGLDEKGTSNDDMLFLHGAHPEEDFPYSGPFQRLIWQREEFSLILDEFNKMMIQLQDHGEK